MSIVNNNENEMIIAENILESINSCDLLNCEIYTLDRIISIYFSGKNHSRSDEKKVIDFLFQYLDKHGRISSILFTHLTNCSEKNYFIKRLHKEYKDKFDFNLVNSALFDISDEFIKSYQRIKVINIVLVAMTTLMFLFSFPFSNCSVFSNNLFTKYFEFDMINKALDEYYSHVKDKYNNKKILGQEKEFLLNKIKIKSAFENKSITSSVPNIIKTIPQDNVDKEKIIEKRVLIKTELIGEGVNKKRINYYEDQKYFKITGPNNSISFTKKEAINSYTEEKHCTVLEIFKIDEKTLTEEKAKTVKRKSREICGILGPKKKKTVHDHYEDITIYTQYSKLIINGPDEGESSCTDWNFVKQWQNTILR